jgi:phosphoglucomutase
MAIEFGTPGWRAVVSDSRWPAMDRTHLRELRDAGPFTGTLFDGAAYRFGMLNADRSPISPDQLIALFFDYLVESRKRTDGAARSVALSRLVDRVIDAYGLPVHERPDGFKYTGELINEDKIVIGGEEQAQLSIKGHYPEKDGILACLPAAEAVATRSATLSEAIG